MSGGGGGTTKTNADPWKGVQPYLIGGTGVGQSDALFPMSLEQYKSGLFSPEMEKANQSLVDLYKTRQNDNIYGELQNGARDAISGYYDPVINPVEYISGADKLVFTDTPGVEDITTGKTNLPTERAAQGSLDPTESLTQLLSGEPNNPYLRAINRGNIEQGLRANRDANQQMAQQILPSIRSGAIASGQYGGSRQGIAEGLAMQQMARNSRDLGIAAMASGNELFGGAYESAQNRMADAASELNLQSERVSESSLQRELDAQQVNAANQLATQQFNASLGLNAQQVNAANQLATQQFNAGLGLDNNTQEMALQNQIFANRLQGIDALNVINQMQELPYQQELAQLAYPSQYNQNLLGQYANILVPGTGLGSSTETKQSGSQVGQAFKGAAGGALAGAAASTAIGSTTAVAGTATGAATGAAAGTATFPVVGTAIGALLGVASSFL